MTRSFVHRGFLLLWATGVTATILPSNALAQRGESEADDVKERVAAFREARADASGQIPPGAWATAWNGWQSLSPWSASLATDASWRPLGPFGMFGNQINFGGIGQLVAGRVTSISVHPTDPQTLYVGAASGGVWKSTTGGATWAPLTDSQCSPAIGAVAVDPVNPALVYAGTGEINTFEFAGCGVLSSTDGGATWSAPTSNPVGSYHGKILVDPATAGTSGQTTLVAATSGGLYVSTNSGATWTRKVTGVAWSAVALPGRPGTYFAAVTSPSRTPASTVWRSTDGGATWVALPTPLSSMYQVARVELATTSASNSTVIAFAADYSTRKFAGLYRWSEVTQQWTQLPSSGLVTSASSYPFTIGEQSEYNLVVAVDPRNAQRIWVAGVGAFLSEDGGLTFRSVAKTVHVDWHAIAFSPSDPDHMYAGTDGGLYVSYDAGRTWRAQNNGLAIAQFYPGISVHPSGQWIFGGLQDNQAAYFSGSKVWSNFATMGDGGYTAVNYLDPRIVYVTHAFLNFIERKGSGLATESRSAGISSLDRSGARRPLVMHPLVPTTLYFGTQRLYRTTNEGQYWIPISTDLTLGSGYITTIAIAPSNPNVIYVGTSDGVISRTLDGGITYSQFAFAVSRYFTRIAVNPTNPLHIVATASTFGAPTITQSTDGGATFYSSISSKLAGIPVHTALFLPGTSTMMFGTEFGVIQTVDGGTTWTAGPPGFPNTVVYDLAYVPATTTVVASTYGRGMFAFNVGPSVAVLRGDIDRDGAITAADALLLQQALVGVDLAPLTPYPHGDTNCDRTLDGVDVLLTLRLAVGLPNSSSACVGTVARPGTMEPGRRITVLAN